MKIGYPGQVLRRQNRGGGYIFFLGGGWGVVKENKSRVWDVGS